jgi:hypothetical protein
MRAPPSRLLEALPDRMVVLDLVQFTRFEQDPQTWSWSCCRPANPGRPFMSDRNVLVLGCSRAYDRGENPFCGLNFPGPRGVRADLAAIGGPGECL